MEIILWLLDADWKVIRVSASLGKPNNTELLTPSFNLHGTTIKESYNYCFDACDIVLINFQCDVLPIPK